MTNIFIWLLFGGKRRRSRSFPIIFRRQSRRNMVFLLVNSKDASCGNELHSSILPKI